MFKENIRALVNFGKYKAHCCKVLLTLILRV